MDDNFQPISILSRNSSLSVLYPKVSEEKRLLDWMLIAMPE
jgi:hypothetical protein